MYSTSVAITTRVVVISGPELIIGILKVSLKDKLLRVYIIELRCINELSPVRGSPVKLVTLTATNSANKCDHMAPR